MSQVVENNGTEVGEAKKKRKKITGLMRISNV